MPRDRPSPRRPEADRLIRAFSLVSGPTNRSVALIMATPSIRRPFKEYPEADSSVSQIVRDMMAHALELPPVPAQYRVRAL
jgi:hypothetical protein